MQNKSSGIFKILGVIGAVILFFVLQSFFPSFTTIFLVIAGIFLFLLVLLVLLLIYFSKKEQGDKTSSDANAVLAKARSKVIDLRQLKIRAKNQQVRDLSEEICGIADKILRALKEQPKDIPSARQFLNYYNIN